MADFSLTQSSPANPAVEVEPTVPLLSIGVHVRADGAARRGPLSYAPVIMAAAPAPKVVDAVRISMTIAALPRARAYARYSTAQ